MDGADQSKVEMKTIAFMLDTTFNTWLIHWDSLHKAVNMYTNKSGTGVIFCSFEISSKWWPFTRRKKGTGAAYFFIYRDSIRSITVTNFRASDINELTSRYSCSNSGRLWSYVMGRSLKISSMGLLNVISVSSSLLCKPINQIAQCVHYRPLSLPLQFFPYLFISVVVNSVFEAHFYTESDAYAISTARHISKLLLIETYLWTIKSDVTWNSLRSYQVGSI